MADIYILNQDRIEIGLIDDYESLIWTPRYFEAGDFEIYMKASERILSLLQLDNYVTRPDSDMVGIIERVKLESDPENGDHIIASGRCAKSILDRRIVWSMTTISDTVENGVRRLLTENLIAPTLSYRTVPNFVLGASQGFRETMSAQYTGDNVLEVVVNLCKQNGYGFKVVLNAERNFEFQMYSGTNRSYDQSSNPYIVFSPEFENIVSSEYEHDKTALRNACNVGGEGEGRLRKFYGVGTVSGLERREMFVDAKDISSELDERDDDGDPIYMSNTAYNALLEQRGLENLAENPETTVFEGEVESIRQYVFNRDYFLGDVVTVKSKHGVTKTSRVVGVIQSHDKSGSLIIPAFSYVETPIDEVLSYLLTENNENLTTEDGETIVI